MALDMTSLTLVKQRLPEVSGTTQDTLLTALIQQTSAAAENVMSRRSLIAATTEDFDLRAGQRTVHLRAWPVNPAEDVIVKFDATYEFAADTELEEGTDYYLDAIAGLLRLHSIPLLPSFGSLRVTTTGGMAADATAFAAAYPDIAGAVADQVAFAFRRRGLLGLASKGIGGSSVAIASQDWLPSSYEIIRYHARWRGVG